MKIPDNVIAALAQKAGWRGNDLVIATAVAIAESQGDSDATNPSTATGLWQVRYSAHPDILTRLGITSQNQLTNVLKNSAAAYQVWKQQGWNAWTTYSQGTYKQYLPRAEAAVANPTNPSFQQLTGSNGSSITGLGKDGFFGIPGVFGWQSSGSVTDTSVKVGTSNTGTGGTDITSPLQFLGKLTQKSLWLRVAEIIAGILALMIGLYIAAKGLK